MSMSKFSGIKSRLTFINGRQIWGAHLEKLDLILPKSLDGEQKTEDSKGASSSSFHHLSSTQLSSSQAAVWPLSSETRTLTPETLH